MPFQNLSKTVFDMHMNRYVLKQTRKHEGLRGTDDGICFIELTRRRVHDAAFDLCVKLKAAATTSVLTNTSPPPGNAPVPMRLHATDLRRAAVPRRHPTVVAGDWPAKKFSMSDIFSFSSRTREKKLNKKLFSSETAQGSAWTYIGYVTSSVRARQRCPAVRGVSAGVNPGENRDTLTRGRCLRTRARPFVYWRSARPRRSGSRPPLYARVRRLRGNE